MTDSAQSRARRFVTSVFAADRVGLLRDVTQAVFALDGNIGSIRQTVVDGFFTLVFTADFPGLAAPEALRALVASALDAGAVVTVMECPDAPRAVVPEGSRFVVTTRGEDRPGTIFAITSFLVGHGVNIEDWVVENDGGQVVYIAQVVVPDAVDFKLLQGRFRAAMAERDLAGLLCHENIFRATNEIGPIKALL
jgi:glycine cleavage system transcriptional repressor